MCALIYFSHYPRTSFCRTSGSLSVQLCEHLLCKLQPPWFPRVSVLCPSLGNCQLPLGSQVLWELKTVRGTIKGLMWFGFWLPQITVFHCLMSCLVPWKLNLHVLSLSTFIFPIVSGPSPWVVAEVLFPNSVGWHSRPSGSGLSLPFRVKFAWHACLLKFPLRGACFLLSSLCTLLWSECLCPSRIPMLNS